MIACSIRSIFEQSISALIQSTKFTQFCNSIKSKGLEEQVSDIIRNINTTSNLQQISNSSGINYNSLKNMLIPDDFKNSIKNAHLGAHKSTTYITKEQIENLAKKSSFFLVIINEIINNQKIVL